MTDADVDQAFSDLPPEVLAMMALNDLASEDIPREGEVISGQEMLEAIREYFDADEIEIASFPLKWLLESIASDDVDRVITAGLVNGMLYLAYMRVRHAMPANVGVDYAYHTFAALRIRLECRFSELTGDEPSIFRTKIN